MDQNKRWAVPISNTAMRTCNPIRNIVDTMKITPNPDLEVIKIHIGDPTIFGTSNLVTSQNSVDAFCDAIKSGKGDGYSLAHGMQCGREAVAKYCSTPDYVVDPEDVVLTSGCSGALELTIDVLADAGDNILIPRPGFSLYKTIAGSRAVETRGYNLIPEKSWEIDLDHMESLMDERTKMIVLINPSNPCGSVYTKEHIEAILAVAEKHQLPVMCDEIYAHCTFGDRPFYSVAPLSKNVPVLTTGGMGKRFLVPGWRMGWIIINDRNGAFGPDFRVALRRLTHRLLGPCAPLQAALPTIFGKFQPEFFEKTCNLVKRNAEIFNNTLSQLPQLSPIKPHGAMYMLIGINIDQLEGIKDDVEFTERLVGEQSVMCLPSQCFDLPNFFRVVLLCPEAKAHEACARIVTFCKKHAAKSCCNAHVNGGVSGE